MKDKLTIEQSALLIAFGVSSDKASEIEEYKDDVSQWTHRGAPIFTLNDVLKLLPKEIYSDEREILYFLTISMDKYRCYVRYKNLSYCKNFGPTKHAPELIDALYELLCWTIQNKYLKL